ncbi:uncharacterized protein LOC112345354 [Selaginella moellendorffii]|uniref:uncharacterized protein LOC112345354 n=1 Tax=Selaginella moellendorffii TaxID=88036 RepID=UPI000D1C2816|nr:uncharacterized protein LOC112345354 [Selaginella moellendorffii]|eukprot:XP_024527630.1 uncharacterized protein LOC112345354 [Selaginella moellendorffii]
MSYQPSRPKTAANESEKRIDPAPNAAAWNDSKEQTKFSGIASPSPKDAGKRYEEQISTAATAAAAKRSKEPISAAASPATRNYGENIDGTQSSATACRNEPREGKLALPQERCISILDILEDDEMPTQKRLREGYEDFPWDTMRSPARQRRGPGYLPVGREEMSQTTQLPSLREEPNAYFVEGLTSEEDEPLALALTSGSLWEEGESSMLRKTVPVVTYELSNENEQDVDFSHWGAGWKHFDMTLGGIFPD